MKADVEVVVPLDDRGEPSVERQRELAREFRSCVRAQAGSVVALQDVLRARMTVEM